MKKFLRSLTLASAMAFAGAASADDNDSAFDVRLIEGDSFILDADRTDYLRRTYGYALWRHWEHVPQVLRDNFSTSEDNPIWKHHYLLSRLEKELQGVNTAEERRNIFDTIVNDLFSEDAQASVQHYLPIIQTYLNGIGTKTAYEAGMMDRYLSSVSVASPNIIVKSPPSLSSQEEIDSFNALYSDTATGRGVRWGEYGVTHSLQGEQIVATDFLMDCVAVVLTSVNPNDTSDRYAVLAHVDATTQPREAIAKLLSEIPEGHVVHAQILGSDRNENAYMNVALAEALVLSDRIASIAVNTEAATTVVVHAQSGTVLTHNDLDKGEHNAYEINTLPVQVEFGERPPFSNFRALSYDQLLGMRLDQEFQPMSKLVRVAHPTLRNEAHPALDATVEAVETDNIITRDELELIARVIEDNMHVPNGACVSVGELRVEADIGTGSPVGVGYTSRHVKYESVRGGRGCKKTPSP